MEEKNQFQQYLQTKQNNFQSTIITDSKEYLFNLVSSCLLKEMRYYDTSEDRFDIIQVALNVVAQSDPEFILKLALYLRHQLYIRTTTNFILAFCVLHEKTQNFIQKYFGTTIILPTDLIETCSYVQFLIYQMKKSQKESIYLSKNIRQKLVFPQILQICVREKFPQFSLYQLGKYCSDNARKKMLYKYKQFSDIKGYLRIKQKHKYKNDEVAKKKILSVIESNIMKHQQARQNLQKNQFDVNFLCMKDIIRYCHCKEPQYSIRCILGKKNPTNQQEFENLYKNEIKKFQLKSNTDGDVKFNKEKAEKRMKLEIPQTWETEISKKGNKKEVWEQLINMDKLPYMAMLRNLRNILKSKVCDITHTRLITKLCDQKLVIKSKIFPIQYYSALNEIDKMLKLANGEIESYNEVNERPFLSRLRGGRDYQLKRSNSLKVIKNCELSQESKHSIKLFAPIYKQAINKAIDISVQYNLDDIKGLTIVLADVSGSMQQPMSGGKRYGSIQSCLDCALLLGLMIRSKCQQCDFYMFSSPSINVPKGYQKVLYFNSNDYLQNIEYCKQINKLGNSTKFPVECIIEYQQSKRKIDNIVILSDLMLSNNNSRTISKVINNYRNQMNSSLKIFSVDLVGYGQELKLADEFNETNFIRIFGMSDTILRFISLRERSQMQEIHNYAEVKVAQYQDALHLKLKK